jgi:hypothetical protein
LIASLYQGQNITVPTSADVECEWDDKRLKLSWITDIGTSGSAETAKSNADQPSIFVPLAMTWDDFKKYIIGFEPFRLYTEAERILGAYAARFIEPAEAICAVSLLKTFLLCIGASALVLRTYST